MKHSVDFSKWIQREEVAKRLGIMPRTVYKLTQTGELNPQLIGSAGKPGRGSHWYDPDEVESVRLKRQANTTALVPTTHRAIARQPEVITVPNGKPDNPTQETLMVPVVDKRYLTLAEAVAYTGLGAFYLMEELGPGDRKGPRGACVYKRDTLDRL